MKRVLTAAVLVPVVLLILFKAPNWLYSAFIELIAVLAVHEYFGIAFHYQQKLLAYVVEVAIGLYFLGQSLFGINAFGIENFGRAFDRWATDATGVRVLPLVLVALGMFLWPMKDVLPAAAFSYFGFIYVALTLGEISRSGILRMAALPYLSFFLSYGPATFLLITLGALSENISWRKPSARKKPGKALSLPQREPSWSRLCSFTTYTPLERCW